MDPAVFNTDRHVCLLRDLRIMRDHNNRLMEHLAGHLQKVDHLIAGTAVQIPGRFIRQDDRRF